MRRFKVSILLLFATLCVCGTVMAEQEVKARVAGLESNESYMQLLKQELSLQRGEDSLQRSIVLARDSFRADTESRSISRDRILRLENEIFDIRKKLGVVAGQLSVIEQEFIIQSLSGSPAKLFPDSLDSLETEGGAVEMIDNRVVNANIVYNDFFSNHLAAADYATLLDAQSKEQVVTNYLKIYQNNYNTISKLLAEYKLVENAESADSLYSKYTHLAKTNSIIADSIDSVWDYVFDNKIFSYNYLLDALHKMDLLSGFERKGQEVRSKQAQLRDRSTSLEVASYALLKALLLDYETSFASLYDVEPALDSLNKVENALRRTEYNSPRIEVEERLFLDYADFEISSPAKYSARNPIPTTIIHPRGMIYRVLVGSYQRAQPISIFRGVSPLSYMVVERRHLYYVGGYRTLKACREAKERLNKLGFRAPKIALWSDGNHSLLSDNEAEDGVVFYHIEISGAGDTLGEAVIEAINKSSEGREISRSGDLFTVGSFSSATEAQRVLEAIKSADPKLDVKSIEI